jgi:hypothetical protein
MADWRHHAFITNVEPPTVAVDQFHRDHATVELPLTLAQPFTAPNGGGGPSERSTLRPGDDGGVPGVDPGVDEVARPPAVRAEGVHDVYDLWGAVANRDRRLHRCKSVH